MIAEYNNATTLLRRYVHGSNAEADDPLVWYEGTSVASSNARHLHADPRGSIVLVAGSAGQTLAINTYDEYGIPDTASGNDIATKGRFRYTGQAWLPELDMYHYKARVYSPTLGRFLQTDPIGYEDQFNLYAYVGNDPVNGVDPTGQVRVIAVVVGAVLTCAVKSACRKFVVRQLTKKANETRDVSRKFKLDPPTPPRKPRSRADDVGDRKAEGHPHSVPKGRGGRDGYTTYGPADPKTGKPESTKEYRPEGKPHGDIPRPNVKERLPNEAPDGTRRPGKPDVRPPRADEIPR